MKKILVLLFILTSFSFAQIKVGVVFSIGGLGDMAFNDSTYAGLVRAKKNLGINFTHVEPASPSEDEGYLREFAQAKYDLVIGVGFLMKDSIEKSAKAYPKTKFLLLDETSDLPNVASITFNEEEMGFLAGSLAGMMTKSNKIAFIGGMEIPLVDNYLRGYIKGSKYINPKTKVLNTYVFGSNPFNDPYNGYELTYDFNKQGADVFFSYAGGTGFGIINACTELEAYAIGVENNHDGLSPGTVLSSVIKNMDIAVYDVVKSVKEGKFKGGNKIYGIKENGIAFTNFKYTKTIIGQEKISKLETIKKDIVSKKIDLKNLVNEEEKELFSAIDKNDLITLRKIIANNKELISEYSTEYATLPLDYAIKNNKIDIVKLFVDNGIGIEDLTVPYSALEKAIDNPNYEILDYLISKGTDVNFSNDSGLTLLDKADNSNNEKLADYLISKGAIPNKIANWETIKMVDEFGDPTGEVAIINSNEKDSWLRIRKVVVEVDVKQLDENNNEILNEYELPVYKKENNVIYKIGMHYDEYLGGKGTYDSTSLKIKNEKNELSKTFTGYVWDGNANNLSLYDENVDEFIEFLKKSSTVKIAASDYNDSFHSQTFNVEKLEKALKLIKLP